MAVERGAGVHRPALPHERPASIACRRRGRRAGGRRSRADPPGDHRPRSDRRRAGGARAGTGRADGHRRRGGQDRGRRPDLPVPGGRRSRPACRRPRRSRRLGRRAASSGSRIRSIACADRCCATRRWRRSHRASTGSRRTTPGCVGRGNERAVEFAREHGLPGGGRLGRPFRPGGRRSPTPRLDGDPGTPAGLLAALAGAQLVPGTCQPGGPGLDAGRQARPASARQRPGRADGRPPGPERTPRAAMSGLDPEQDHRWWPETPIRR